ncbi:glycosyltransferase family 39 protein [Methanobacterium formicicum]|uniref:Glycosyltransferase family 39 protein n=1 Tax=Methanobacterium formicicum TaxID=2162 RepID=A0A843AFQ1_METFO|nr:glycosyltransferase family 39 protein [Methanobacterium formicicum]MBF4474372.1 glycosyltransferase family 39 protein [Methanobacterium formicicum]
MHGLKIKDQRSKWVFLILLALTVSVIAYYRVKLQIDLGAIIDTYDYLANAAALAGKGIGFDDFNRPPFMSILTAIFFLFGGLSIDSIMIVDGILYVFGCVGLYLFLKNFFDSLTSFIGSLLFATFPIVITFAGAGINDVSGVSMGIWAIYLTYMAVKKDSRLFLISFPVAMLAFLTRYNLALLIFPIMFYILINREKIKNSRNVLIGMGIALILIIPLLYFFSLKFGNPIYPFIDFFKTSGGAGSTEHFAYNQDSFYFIKNMPFYIGFVSLGIVFFTLLGLIFRLFRKTRVLMDNVRIFGLKDMFINFKFILMLVFVCIFLLSFAKVHYMVSEAVFFIICYLLYLVGTDFSIDMDKDLLFIIWFMAFFIFQSVYVAKDHRYFITMVVPLAYFLSRAFNWSVKELQVKFKDVNIIRCLFAILLTVLMLFSVSSQLHYIEQDNQNNKVFTQDVQTASTWLKGHDPEYKSKLIYADLWSYFGWFLQTKVGKMPIFRNNQTLYVGAKDYNFTEQDKMAFNSELEKTKPDYYISVWPEVNFTSYNPIQKLGTVIIYQRVN